jgi:trehalose 6-phosphate phosphatase
MRQRGGGPIDAVLFDMDGVVTDTAKAHAAAWERLFNEFLRQRGERSGEEFRPFDPEGEYREFVDGKPRHDGIRSFLAARGIELPDGNDDDPDDAETICALARRKQHHFHDWLETNQVRTYPGTLKLVRDLAALGIPTAVFSASRNAEAVLRNAGALDLFEAKFDGNDLARLGKPGKPDPAMLMEAAARLGVGPERAAVVEDSIAGIEAGRRGGFALVVAIARNADEDAPRAAGADLVVNDAAELLIQDTRTIALKTLQNVPDLWDRESEFRQRLEGKQPAVFLDYDGTLTPIVEDHRKAFLSEEMRSALTALSRQCLVAIVSGRDLAMLRQLVGVEGVFYAGSHGFEIAGPDDTIGRFERGQEFLPELDDAERQLREALSGIAGCAVERKRFSIAVHFRQVSAADVDKVRATLDNVLDRHPKLALGHGKKVFEIQPGIEWNKGRAVLWLRKQLGLDRDGVVSVYIGDDITDEHAFRALAGEGIGIVVRDTEPRRTAADYALADTAQVRRLIEQLRELAPVGQGRP